ncbi:ATP-dependent Clp protease adaptor ClpS [Pseudobacteroides cellulosolvens]|uniref:ATP-dependent Clp protease adapter protein ClpS n=1 Tax=Pseudobacteroides cellulosolvens ATCC 35603 = DSM 2933 TaxID=398512 RepID=A0A0L6JMT2_9FIRM|nr:ATP-dependent Clp protease adaptor ClpS [Pseudobacteroides cellulosolvens]KNY27106.1 ATP-dependent Clp protease adapter protein clpS [Pseudobacteroides cellulosolvens ATCC 35603 = DSM 2933]
MSDKVISKEDIKNLIKKPNMYRVILLNDDYTTMEFVINVLMVVFHKSITEATLIMLDVHKKGKGIVGLYTYDIALTKINQVESMAAESGYPLKSIMEKE